MKFQYQLTKDKYMFKNESSNKSNFLVKIIRKIFKWHFESIMHENVQNGDINNFNICLNDDGITVASDISEIHIGWKAMKSMKTNGDFIIIKYGLNKKITMPAYASAFKDEDEKAQFMNALRQGFYERQDKPSSFHMPENASFNFKFTYSVEQEEFFYQYDMNHSKRGKLITMLSKYVVPIAYSVFICTLGHILGGFIFALTIIFAVSAYAYYIKVKYPKETKIAVKKLMKKSHGHYDSKSEKRVSLGDEGVFLENSHVTTFIEWGKLNNFNVFEVSKHIGISSTDTVIFWIPVSAFESSEEKEEFMRRISLGN